MAKGKNEVTLTFAGDSKKLEKAFDNVGASAKGMESDVGRAAKGFDDVGDAADKGEQKIMGMKDTVDGAATIMKGPGEQGIAAYLQGWADLASGMANFVIPALKAVSLSMAKTAIAAVQSAATQVVAWTTLAFQATLNAAKIAVAWLISMGPIALVGAAVIALVVLIVKNWDTIKNAITGAATAVLDFLKRNWPMILAILTGPIGLAVLAIAKHKDSILDFFRGIPAAIGGFFSGIGEIISAPFRNAFAGIKSAWNNTVGGKGFTVPSWVPGIGGNEFRIPKLHTGGIVPGTPGSETLALLQAGERVIPAGGTSSVQANPTFEVHVFIGDQELKGMVRAEIRERDRNTRRAVTAGASQAVA